MPRSTRGTGGGAVEAPDACQTPPAGRHAIDPVGDEREYPQTAPANPRAIQSLFRQSERSFQSQVVRYAEMMGWLAYHTWDSRRSQAGFPDLVLVRRPRVVWAELKSERGKATPDQVAWLTELRACDQEAYLWRPSSWREVERVLR